MRNLLVAMVGAGAIVLAIAAAGHAEVNCKLVQKDMSMGRTAEDIAERMGASVDEVKKCAADANAGGAEREGTGTGTVAPGAAEEGAADKPGTN